MPRTDPPNSAARDTRLEREIARERNEHMLNHDAKAQLNFNEDERHKDARETSFSSMMRR
jgi:hypothetical protein